MSGNERFDRYEELKRAYEKLEDGYAELMLDYLDLERYCERLEQGYCTENGTISGQQPGKTGMA